MAATTLSSPQQQQQQQQQHPHHHHQQPLGESNIANRLDMDPNTIEKETKKKKRKSEANDGPSKKMKKRESVLGKHCHQCHQHRDSFVECTVLTTRGKRTERCGKIFCQDCLKRRYDEDVPTIISADRPKDLNKLLGHIQTELYVWRCPICSKNCNCAPHRKQYGLAPTGFITSLAKEKGLTVPQLLQDPGAMEAARLAKEAIPKKFKTSSQDPEPTVKGGGSDQRGKKAKKSANKVTDKPKDRAAEKVTAKGKEKASKSTTDKTHRHMVPTTILPAPIKPFIKQPKHVEDPEFEFIGISYPLGVIEKRLRVREFVLRFEKKMIKLPPKYFRTINDPNSEWTDLTYRNLITSLLPIIQADGNHLIHGDFVYEAIQEIKKTTAENPKIWTILKNLLEEAYSGQLPDDFNEEEVKLDAIMLVLHLALQATVIRQEIDDDLEKEKDSNRTAIAEIKRLKADWEQTKSELQKERLLLKPGERANWDDRYTKAFNANKKLIARVEERQWFISRKTCTRTTPLGVDAKGNTYWMFTQRDKKDEDWGQWIVVQKNEALPHPSGTLPKLEDELSGLADNESDAPENENEDTIKSRIWYAISGAQNVRHLAEWIQYQTNLALFKKAMVVNDIVSDSSSLVQAVTVPLGTPKKYRAAMEKVSIDTPSRQLMVEVRLPQRSAKKADPGDLVTEESTEAFVAHLQKIANFMELNEEPQRLF